MSPPRVMSTSHSACWKQSLRVPLALLAAAATTFSVSGPASAASGTTLPATATQEGYERIFNGTFDSGTADPWWSYGSTLAVVNGQLCVTVPGGTANPWDAGVGQNAIVLELDEPYTFSFTASADRAATIRAGVQLSQEPYTSTFSQDVALTETPQNYEFTFDSTLENDNAQVVFQVGGHAEDLTICLDNISLIGGQIPPGHVPDTGPAVRVNQLGYATYGPKRATVVAEETTPLPWRLLDAGGTVVASGQTTVFGDDPASGTHVHQVDFSDVTTEGTGFTLEVEIAGEPVASYPFEISQSLYDRLRYDALAFFYHQRSGIEISADLVGEEYARPAGHLDVPPNQGDTNVPCMPGTCDYSLDVRGGWYDAGDHGKYVVNGGISAWQLLNQYERALIVGGETFEAFADGTLAIPEASNGVPDLLDEARWEVEFLLRMQVPEGEELAGMAHHKIHDEQWTGLPMLPHEDPQPRYLHPPSTAATLNLAAVAAQCARLWRAYDEAFADQCLTAAERAWDAAVAHPDIYADPNDGVGGGTYSDSNVTDEFYWAAAELFVTTGATRYLDFLRSSPHFGADNFTAGGFAWLETAPLGDITLSMVDNDLPEAERDAVTARVIAAADRYVATIASEGFGLPYAPYRHEYVWGSNSQVLNNAIVIATAYDLTGEQEYARAALESFDYILGRNALNLSYVTGYGTVYSQNQHHRFWANQLDASLPHPPAGTLAGGPNVGLQDPIAARELAGCAPQWCYIDHIESWSTNEVTINWNAPLAWLAAFAAEQAHGDSEPQPPVGQCSVQYVVHSQWGSGFVAEVTIHNTGDQPIDGWELEWTFSGDQRVTQVWNATLEQNGATVTASNVSWNQVIQPDGRVTFGFLGTYSGTNSAPTTFLLNGVPCSG